MLVVLCFNFLEVQKTNFLDQKPHITKFVSKYSQNAASSVKKPKIVRYHQDPPSLTQSWMPTSKLQKAGKDKNVRNLKINQLIGGSNRGQGGTAKINQILNSKFMRFLY